MLSFSSEGGTVLICQLFRDLWTHTSRDHQLEAVTKAAAVENFWNRSPWDMVQTVLLCGRVKWQVFVHRIRPVVPAL